MDKKGFFMGKKIFLFFAFACFSFCAFSRSLSFQIVQHNESLDTVCRSAYIIEDEIMNYFFENGFIVSNAEAGLSSSEEQDRKLWNDAYYDALEGSFDEFVQIHLYFNDSADNSEESALGMIDSVSWSITSVKTGKRIEEKKISVKKPMDKDNEANVRDFANGFASHIKQVLRNRV